MKPLIAEVVYYTLLALGYVWSGVQLAVGQPFDAFVLFIVTFAFQSYRNEIHRRLSE